ncbi:hypothetical protein JTB14_020716 [Gonioctena quinquepunctata]|nr:hypothetical protein JTB14_020716 [Gonioctena quinquepunctata]
MTKLKIATVIFDSKHILSDLSQTSRIGKNSQEGRIVRNANDLDDEQFSELASRVKVQLQGKEEINLWSQIGNDADLRKEISLDLLISLLDNILTIGSERKEIEIYIDRKLKLHVVDKSILKNGKYLFIISGLSKLKLFKCMSLDYRMIEMKNDDTEEFDYEEPYPILISEEPFSRSHLMKLIEKIAKVDKYCFLQVDKNYGGKYRFIIMETKGSVDDLRSDICVNEYYYISDEELLQNNLNSKINIICDNAGTGKTPIRALIYSLE